MIQRMRNARFGARDEGVALILVIGIGMVLSILLIGAVSFAISGQKISRSSQDWDGALSAAYAGVEEYQSRMAADPSYWRFGNALATFSASSASTVTAPDTANPAFGVGSSGTWANVPVPTDPGYPQAASPAQFRYEVDNSDYSSTGVLRIRATGKVGGSTRTLVADLKQKGFLDFLYFTDYEVRDPAVSNTSCTPAYDWAVSSRPNCTEIQFGSGDTLNGPVHSNDTLLICGATFTGNVTSARPTAPYYEAKSGCGQPTFSSTAKPKYSPVIGMPSTNSELKKETRSDLPADVPNSGCLYTGPTSIEFAADGKMRVRSPWTKLTNITGDPATGGSVSSKCGTPGTSGLGSAAGQVIDVLKNTVIYVQNIPSTAGAPNYSSSATTGSGATCLTPDGANATGNGIGFPASGELAPSTSSSNPSYGCRNGDVFVKGTVSGQVTVAAENFVYATGDIRYNDAQKDMMGLVGQNAVYVYSPIKCTATNGSGQCTAAANLNAASDRRIDSAILSVAHFFQVQNYEYGTYRGVLTINGAIAQKFRGTVATTSGSTFVTGFAKNYLYDTRFRYTAPPKFLSPVTTTYGVTVSVETNRAFDSLGNQL